MLDLKTLSISVNSELKQTVIDVVHTAPKNGEIISHVNATNREKACALQSMLHALETLLKLEESYLNKKPESESVLPIMLSNAA